MIVGGGGSFRFQVIVVVIIRFDVGFGVGVVVVVESGRGRLSVVLGGHMLIQLVLDVEGFFAEVAFELLLMGGKVDLEVVFFHETLLTKEAAIGLGFAQVADLDVQLPLHFRAEGVKRRVRAHGAFVQFTFVGVLDGEVDLNGDFGIEHFFAQRAAVQMMSVDVHQMLLQLVRFGEFLVAALAPVFHGRGQEMRAGVGIQRLFRSEGLITFAASVRQLLLLLLLLTLLLLGR